VPQRIADVRTVVDRVRGLNGRFHRTSVTSPGWRPGVSRCRWFDVSRLFAAVRWWRVPARRGLQAQSGIGFVAVTGTTVGDGTCSDAKGAEHAWEHGRLGSLVFREL
jgi:hypothetical protein